MVFLMNSECPNIYLLKKMNKPHGIFCLIKKSYSTLCPEIELPTEDDLLTARRGGAQAATNFGLLKIF